jgi:hypothetical protein
MVFFGCIQQDRFRFPRDRKLFKPVHNASVFPEVHRQHIPRMQGRKNQRHAFPVIFLQPTIQNRKGNVYGRARKLSNLALKNGLLLIKPFRIFVRPVPPVKISRVKERCARGFDEKRDALIGGIKRHHRAEPFNLVRLVSVQILNIIVFRHPRIPLDIK